MYVLRIKPDNDEVKAMYENHGKFHDGDDGLDLYVPETVTIPGGQPWKSFEINHQICCEMIGFVPMEAPQSIITQMGNNSPRIVLKPFVIGYYLLPRSSFKDTPLVMANHIGLIDKGYRGQIKAFVRNLSNEDFVIEKGTRLFQISSKDSEDFTFKIVGELSETSRGSDGFGSTGTK
jgi:dUTP pyrophosphatase